MAQAFEACVDGFQSTMTDDDWGGVVAHSAVAYVLSPPLARETAEEESGRALQLIAALFDRGAVAVKNESAGSAHGREFWTRVADEYTTAVESGDLHSAGSALCRAWIRRIIHDADSGHYYTCGLHLLGQPDTEIPDALEPAEAVRWLDLMALYVLADRPTRPILDGDTFGLVDDGPRRVIRHTACTRYEDDEFFFNPYGYRSLVE